MNTRTRKRAVALALLGLALYPAPTGAQGAAHGATGATRMGNPVRLAQARAVPDYLRYLAADRMVHLPAICRHGEKHVYPPHGGASQQFRDKYDQDFWTTLRRVGTEYYSGRSLAGYEPVNGDLYTWQPVLLACWRS